MGKICFIRTYKQFGNEECDIVYEKNGRPYRCCSMPVSEMPRTAKLWLVGKTGTKAYDKTLEREETIYE